MESKRSWVLFIVSFATFLRSFGQVMYTPSLAQMRLDLEATTGLIGLSLSAYGIVLAVSQLGIGPLVDRFDARRIQIAGLSLFGIASLLAGLAGGIWLFLIVRGLQALGIAAAASVGIAYISDLYAKEQQGRATAVFEVFNAAGAAAGPAIGASLALIFSWRADFFALALLSAILILATIIVVPRSHPPTARLRPDAILEMLKLPATRGALASGFAAFYGLYSIHTILPIFLADNLKWGQGEIGLVLTLLPIGAIIGSLLGGRSGDRFGSQRTLLVGSFAMVAGFGTLTILTGKAGLSSHLAFILSPVFACGLSVGFCLPIQMKIMLNHFPDFRGTAGAVQYSGRFLGASLSPALTGFLIDRFTPGFALASAVILLLAAAVTVTLFTASPN